jgi:type II secretory pathway component PulF
MKNHVIQIVIGGILATLGFRAWVATPDGRLKWDFVKLYVPVVGPLLQRIYLVRFTRSFGTMLSGGLDIPQALTVTADIVGNAHYQKNINETKKEVSDGNSIVTVFMRDKTMPLMVPQMMAVGEETGRLQEVLSRLTDFYTRDLENLVDNLVSAIEPIIMLVMGGAVGIMVAAIMLPMYQMAQQF